MTASGASIVPSTSSSLPSATVARNERSPSRSSTRVLKPSARSGRNSVRKERMWASKLIVASGPGSGQARAPGAERVEHRRDLVAALGELVDLRGGRRGELALADDAVLLEVAQAHGEDVRARVGEARAEVGEALGPEHQLAHRHQRPALSEDVERAGDPARVAVGP
jgi:hypothetical protein